MLVDQFPQRAVARHSSLTLEGLFPFMVMRRTEPSIFGLQKRCLLWLGETTAGGYGIVRWQFRRWLVHRLAKTLEVGPLERGQLVCHKCDITNCCEDEHLFIGTHKSNAEDKRKWSAILPPETIESIIWNVTDTDKTLALRYGLTNNEIATIRHSGVNARRRGK